MRPDYLWQLLRTTRTPRFPQRLPLPPKLLKWWELLSYLNSLITFPKVKGGYVPAGLTPEQYQAVLEKEEAERNAKKQKFFLGKETESLTEWMQVNEKKGLKGVELNRKGHKMVKAKYDGWYTDYSPV